MFPFMADTFRPDLDLADVHGGPPMPAVSSHSFVHTNGVFFSITGTSIKLCGIKMCMVSNFMV